MIECQICFLTVNGIVILKAVNYFHNSSLFRYAEKHLFVLLIDADGLFSSLIRSHYNWAIVIKVSYVKEYNREQKKDGPNNLFNPFGPVRFSTIILADKYGDGCKDPVAA